MKMTFVFAGGLSNSYWFDTILINSDSYTCTNDRLTCENSFQRNLLVTLIISNNISRFLGLFALCKCLVKMQFKKKKTEFVWSNIGLIIIATNILNIYLFCNITENLESKYKVIGVDVKN